MSPDQLHQCSPSGPKKIYRQAGLEPQQQVAGLLLAGLLSDTKVLLKSPTTTDVDRELAGWLARLAGLDAEEFGRAIFTAGSALSAYPSVVALLTADFKGYETGGRRFGVGQVEVVTLEEFHGRRAALATGLAELCRERRLHLAGLLVTDIVMQNSLLLVRGDEELLDLIAYPRLAADLFELKGVLSRKKQLVDRDRRAEEGQPPPDFELRRVLREILIVPETKPASELLVELRSKRMGMAMVVDEFGSILGLVTLEDALEQMVGEIHDEFDVIERPLTLSDGAMVFDAAMNVRDLDTQYNIHLPEDSGYETVGGFVLSQLGFIPRGGESFEHGGVRFTVMDMDRRRIARVKIQRLKSVETVAAEAPEEKKPAEAPRSSP